MFKQPPMVSKGQKTGGAERLEQIHTLLNPPWRWMSSVVLMTSILLSPYAGLRTPGIGPYEGNVHQKSPQIAPDHSKTTQHNSSKSPRIPLHFLQPLVRLWARSWLPTTKAPPVMSEWPPMYLLAEIITSPGMLEKTVEILLEKKHLGILLGTFWAWKKKAFNVRPLEDMEILWKYWKLFRRVVEKSCSSQDLSLWEVLFSHGQAKSRPKLVVLVETVLAIG